MAKTSSRLLCPIRRALVKSAEISLSGLLQTPVDPVTGSSTAAWMAIRSDTGNSARLSVSASLAPSASLSPLPCLLADWRSSDLTSENEANEAADSCKQHFA